MITFENSCERVKQTLEWKAAPEEPLLLSLCHPNQEEVGKPSVATRIKGSHRRIDT